MDGPGSYAFDHSEHGEEGFVVHRNDGVIGEDATAILVRQVVEITGLAFRNADLAELIL